jgi:chemotaxis protein methyltransferase CheR
VERGLTREAREKSFTAHPKGRTIRDELRAMASYRTRYLMDDFSSLGTFDIVFCRNVAIYFNERDRASLFNRIEQRLETGGCLVIGSMESLSAISPQFESKRHLRSVYYQLKNAAAARI